MSDHLITTSPDVGPKVQRAMAALQNAVLLVVVEPPPMQVFRLMEGMTATVGRLPELEVTVSHLTVSRKHAEFRLVNGQVMVEDLGSSHGIVVNGKKVKRAEVSAGDEVRLGAVTVMIQPLLAKPLTTGPGKTHDAFLSALDDEVERARVFRRPMSLAMLSTDTPEADVAAMLREIVRPVDRFSIYGKGVYEVLLPELDAERALALLQPVAQRMRCTVGLASFPRDGTSPDALQAAALQAMRGKSGPPSQDRTPISSSTLVAKSSSMKHLFEMAAKVAASPIPVLLRGETGAGKEVVARFIHEKSLRRGPYVAINCGAIPESLLEATLFGHEKGAFTGAESDAMGVFEQAKEGTLLLDEVGELSAAAQVALLRVLESKEVRRVGGKNTLLLDVRVIAATHRDLEQMVKEGSFRQDLLYRLNAIALEVPPLRDRPEDLGPLIEQFLAEANATSQRAIVGLDREAMQVLLRYAWPGNVRELRNAVERAVAVADEKIMASDLPDRIRNFELHALSAEGTVNLNDLRDNVSRYETQIILDALKRAGGSRSEAAKLLGLPLRTLAHKIRRYGIKANEK